MTNEMKFLFALLAVGAVVYLINKCSHRQSGREKLRETEMKVAQAIRKDMREFEDEVEGFSETNDMSSEGSSESSAPRSKFNSKNKSRGGYKHFNYAEGNRDGGDFGKFFDDNNAVVRNGQLGNNEFTGQDETGGQYAPYTGGKTGQIMSDGEMFNADNWLPKEKRDDWFDTVPEPISVKNRHLINVVRPIGVNTVGNSLRNPSYDIRGTIPNPKFNVGPWNNSTIDPDYNNKGFC